MEFVLFQEGLRRSGQPVGSKSGVTGRHTITLALVGWIQFPALHSSKARQACITFFHSQSNPSRVSFDLYIQLPVGHSNNSRLTPPSFAMYIFFLGSRRRNRYDLPAPILEILFRRAIYGVPSYRRAPEMTWNRGKHDA